MELRTAASGCQKSPTGSFDSLKNFFDEVEKVSDCTRKGGSPPPFHTFPPLPIQRVFSFFDTLGRPAQSEPDAFSLPLAGTENFLCPLYFFPCLPY